MTAALTSVLTGLGPAALLVLFALVFAESGLLVGFFLPGDSLLFAAGLLTAAGLLQAPIAVLIVTIWVAAVLGDQTGYWIGGRLGRLRGRWLPRRHLAQAHVFFIRHGHVAVVLARFVPVVRTLTPVVAGAAAMPQRRFLAYNAAGGLAWSVVMCLAGYFLGGVPLVARHVDVLTVAVIVVSLLPAGTAVLRRRLLRQRAAELAPDALPDFPCSPCDDRNDEPVPL